MKNAPKTIQGNGLLDVLLKGLRLNGDYNEGALGVLAQVSRHYKQRIKQSFTLESLLDEEDKAHLGISPNDLIAINRLVKEIGIEYPAHQPSTDSQWERLESFPKQMQQCLIELHTRVPNIVAHVRSLWRRTDDRHGLYSWLDALRNLYRSGNDEPDLFHGLFLNNHDFAQRAHDLAVAPHSSIDYSAAVLRALTHCRFSSLTMNSAKLNGFFAELTTYIQGRNQSERQYDYTFDRWCEPYISEDDITTFIKEKYYPKTLLWRSVQEPQVTPMSSQNASLSDSLGLSSSDALSQSSRKRKRDAKA
ncbi:MAG: hypothetical protein AB7I18_08690 [Candidatus Berkiella sp.]